MELKIELVNQWGVKNTKIIPINNLGLRSIIKSYNNLVKYKYEYSDVNIIFNLTSNIKLCFNVYSIDLISLNTYFKFITNVIKVCRENYVLVPNTLILKESKKYHYKDLNIEYSIYNIDNWYNDINLNSPLRFYRIDLLLITL